MNINERIIYNILKQLDKMNKDEKFKERNPNILAQEYLYAKLQPYIKIKRLSNILNGKAKRITLDELVHIANALNVRIHELVK